MIQYYTTKEQSKELLKLGLNPETADMCFEYQKAHWPDEPAYLDWPQCYKKHDEQDIPCWSVGALMDLIPKRIVKNNTEYSMCLQTLTHCYSLCHTDGRYLTTLGCQIIGKPLIDAVYQYVVWLIENGYINENEPNN